MIGNIKKIIPFIIFIICFYVFLNSTQANLLTASTTSNLQEKEYSVAVPSEAGNYSETDLESMLSYIIRIVLSIIGTIFLILMIVAGYQWMTASGNEDLIKKSKHTIINLLIGLALVLGAYALTFTFSSLLSSGLLK